MPVHESTPVSASTQAQCKMLKPACYFTCLLALFLSVSPKRIAYLGLFLLLLFAPLEAARWLRLGKVTTNGLLWLLLAVCGAVGVLSSGSGLTSLICFCLSLVFWCAYLCCCVLGKQDKSLKTLCKTASLALFANPCAFFTDFSTTPENRRKQAARYTYVIYILAAVSVLLTILLIQANGQFYMILQTFCILLSKKILLIVSCLLLALFPAMFIYGFLRELKTGALLTGAPDSTLLENNLSQERPSYFPWNWLFFLLTLANWMLLLVEIYYTIYLMEGPPPSEYRFYDIFVVLLLIFISLIALCSMISCQKELKKMACAALGVSNIGLAVIVCYRLGAYIYYYGLWEDRILLCIYFLVCIPFLACSVIGSWRSAGRFIRCTSHLAVILLAILIVIPKGLFLTQVNVQLFLHKYHTQQLSVQRAGNLDSLIALSDEDLRLDIIEGYTIDAIPALTWLVEIEDVTVEGQTLGAYARSAILDYLCMDLNLPRTENNAEDMAAVVRTYADIPRYCLPTNYALAMQRVNRVMSAFQQ